MAQAVGGQDTDLAWCVENRLHWVRDVTYGEDRSQIRTRSERGDATQKSPRSPRVAGCGEPQAVELLPAL